MTTLEIQASVTGSVRMPTLITDSRILGVQESGVVVDCPAYAWDNSDQPAVLDLRNTFGEELIKRYRSSLDLAAHRLIETHLTIEWRNRGYAVAFVYNPSAFEDGATPGPDGTPYATPDDATYLQVWQAAAAAITDKELVDEARLTEVFPLRTDLDRHRKALHHRLDKIAEALAETGACPQAWAQLDGQRAAVDGAVARPQLIALSAQIPS